MYIEWLTQIKGCIVNAWCPEENIYSRATKVHKFDMDRQLKMLVQSELRLWGLESKTSPNNKTFPSKHETVFNVYMVSHGDIRCPTASGNIRESHSFARNSDRL